ncbi:hypothetical protein FEM48_Zijuj01G0319400 [Ziziphus jujuba var. spinosa]|uniref:Uncharacterized protein n=1 Tax=Ziziphus jujuba var. spinosa TaxID=714518 RepID=A0A978W6B7_ZIZJJ|nr:hypothetical protein FEM48_Zijuj01G0316700 [Ziziphus jujuba var. spinosa]KAH7547528.1 hypothetical protein FEM48_Zijuj01G0319400 [Ziziphus jujuba var. spinosa]
MLHLVIVAMGFLTPHLSLSAGHHLPKPTRLIFWPCSWGSGFQESESGHANIIPSPTNTGSSWMAIALQSDVLKVFEKLLYEI